MKRDLTDLLYELHGRRDLRVNVFTGANDAFCAGDDIKSFYDETLWGEARSRKLICERRFDKFGLYGRLRRGSQKQTTAIYEVNVLTIAATNGVCIQSALTFARACDYRIASTNARIGSATLRFGFLPDENDHYMLVRQLGVSKSFDFLLENKIVDGKDALSWGLVKEVTDKETFEAQVL